MEYILEKIKETPIVHEADICVIGGSCTGVFAAVRAARLGNSVTIIENNGFFGGVATAGLVTIWHSNYDFAREKQIIGGLSMEVVERLKKRNAVREDRPHCPYRAFVLNPEELKIELDELITEHKIRPFLHTKFVEPIYNNGKVTAVIIEDKSGRRAIKAKYFIDASGDGDLAIRMGLQFTKDDDLQPPTAVAIFDNYGEIRRQNSTFNLSNEVHNPKYHNALKNGFLWGNYVTGRDESYMIAGSRANNADCSDADQLTQAEISCRSQIRDIGDVLRDNIKGAEKLTLANIAAYIGVRETNHIASQYSITEEDVLTGRKFSDAIGYGTYGVDVHHSKKSGITMKCLDGTVRYMEPGKPAVESRWRDESEGITPYYEIPYRALVPIRGENILVAGRLIGADKGAYGAIRVMMSCNQTGEAAGVACSIALKDKLHVKDVPTDTLRETLRDGGSIII